MTDDSALVLANCLDALEQHTLTLDAFAAQHPDRQTLLMELVPLAQQLRFAPAVTPSLDFRADARRRLEARLPARRPSNQLFAKGLPLFATSHLVVARVLIVLVILIALGSSVVVASAQSLPNDPLYAIKLAIEQVRLALSSDRLMRGELSLSFASERLTEVQRLIERGRGGEAATALTGFAAQIQSAAALTAELPAGSERELLLSRLQASFDRSTLILAETEPQLPQSVQPAVQQARDALHLPPVINPPIVSPSPIATPTLTAIPTRKQPTLPVILSTATATKLPAVRPTRPPVGAATHPPTLIPTRWQTYVPTRWLTAISTLWPTVIATGRSTLRPTLTSPTLTVHPPIATLSAWPTPNPTLPPKPIRTVGPSQTPIKLR